MTTCSIKHFLGLRLALQRSYSYRSVRSISRAIFKIEILLRRRLLFASAALFFAIFFSPVSAETIISDGLSADAVWEREQGPYLISGGFSVSPGRTLTIGPGTIIKLAKRSFFEIEGTLVAQGSVVEPILFTSSVDDGSLNAVPPSGYWEVPMIFAHGSKAFLSHVSIKYGGKHDCSSGCTNSPMVLVQGGEFHASNVTFSDGASAAIEVDESGRIDILDSLFSRVAAGVNMISGSADIHNSAFDRVYAGIYSPSSFTGFVDAARNWWGDAIGPKRGGDQVAGIGSWAYPVAQYQPWLLSMPDVGATSTKASSTDPIVETLSTVRPIIVIPGLLGSIEWAGKWVLDPILHVYDDLMDTLSANGYGASSTLFAFPYDWRKSNALTSELLKKKIDEAKAVCKCPKVDIIAHSMGGLVARSYVQSPGYRDDIGNLIFLAVPHRGAPEDYLAWEGGRVDTSVFNRLLGFVLNLYAIEQGYESSFNYVRTAPISSIQELLPVYDYLRSVDLATSTLMGFPNGYPRNIFLESLEEGFSSLVDMSHASSLKIWNIIGGIATDTVTSLDIQAAASSTPSSSPWADGRPLRIGYGRGDGTVPIESARIDGRDISLSARHTEIPTAAEDIILKILNNKGASTTIHHSNIKRILAAAAHSLVNMAIISPSGKKVGKDFDGGKDAAEIPGAFYSGASAEIQFVSIPDPEEGAYSVMLQGKGGGVYKIEIRDISERSTSESHLERTISIGATSTLGFDLALDKLSAIRDIEQTLGPVQVSVPAPAYMFQPVNPPKRSRPAAGVDVPAIELPISFDAPEIYQKPLPHLSSAIKVKEMDLIFDPSALEKTEEHPLSTSSVSSFFAFIKRWLMLK